MKIYVKWGVLDKVHLLTIPQTVLSPTQKVYIPVNIVQEFRKDS